MILNDNSINLNGIKQSIYFLGKCNVNSFTAGDLDRVINSYYGQLQEVIRGVSENFYMIIAVTNLAINDGTYTFPDGTGTAPAYSKIKSIWAAYQPANIAAPLPTEFERCNIVDANSISQPSYVFSEPTSLMYGDFFIQLPLVTDTTKYPVINGLKTIYIPDQDFLINDTDTPKIFLSFQDAIVWGSLIDILHRLGDEDGSKRYEKKFTQRLKDIVAYASQRIPDEIGVVEGQDNAGGWEYPWGNDAMA